MSFHLGDRKVTKLLLIQILSLVAALVAVAFQVANVHLLLPLEHLSNFLPVRISVPAVNASAICRSDYW